LIALNPIKEILVNKFGKGGDIKMGKKAFTLIELLLVVAIIAILAAIAVPNFLEAQVRSKVSRSYSDMRSIATALESYFTDYNHYPWPYPVETLGIWATNVPNELSTPIAYISSIANIIDPFSTKVGGFTPLYKRFGYIVDEKYSTGAYFWGWVSLTDANEKAIGKWRLDGYGPWGSSGPVGGPSNWPNEPTYDPTNGTVSRGALYRSQRDPMGKQL
jgi:prepilin-type N-terminal cleavage/methylation domain-containing protein